MPENDGVRIAEIVAALSYAADLGLGQPMEHCLRQTVIGQRIAAHLGATQDELEATYYLGLLSNAYCHADAAEQAKWFGDDIAMKGDGYDMLGMSSPAVAAMMLRKLVGHGATKDRVRRLAALPGLQRELVTWFNTHTSLGSQFAERVGLGEDVANAIFCAYEQWDGKGPRGIPGDRIPLAARIVGVAGTMEVVARTRGVARARDVAAKVGGALFDPDVIEVFIQHADSLLKDLDATATWDAVVDAEPRLARRVSGAELDDVLEAMADLVDLKSPYLAGHSRGVANLAAEAARIRGLPGSETTTIRRAGLLHDLGRLGVSNSIWDKPGPLTDMERERAHLHPYLTDKMLSRIPALARSREIAARHHERLDGSGYPRGLTGASLTPADRILAAADVFHAMTEPRPHRDPLSTDQAADAVGREVRARRLDADAVDAVLRAAGRRAPPRREGPAGLTGREVEVLQHLARGLANKEIARRLGLTPKTVSNHVEHIYSKLNVGSRAAATLVATQHGLMGNFTAQP